MKLPTLLARTVFIFFIVSFALFFSSHSSFAQTPPNQQTDTTPSTNSNVPKNLHTYTQNVMLETMSAMICQLAGVDPVNPNQQCLGVDSKTGKIGFVPSASSGQAGGGGAIGVMNNMISMMYTAPIHTGDYVNYLAQNFGVTKPAYAAADTGTGFDGIKPLLALWVAFRNIVYVLFIVLFAVIGFGIMLRIHIDPRTVMTITNQLPKIIITLLLVTFSFAIAGFLIDIMWASMHITYNVFAGANVSADIKKSLTQLSPANIAGKSVLDANGGYLTAAGLAKDTAAGGSEMVRTILGIGMIPLVSSFTSIFDVGSIPNLHLPTVHFPNAGGVFDIVIDVISGFIGFFSSGTVGSMLSSTPVVPTPIAILAGGSVFLAVDAGIRLALPFLIIWIIVFTAVIWALFRVWFALLKAYVSILLSVTLAPFWIAGGLIPGSPIGFESWFRGMIGNLSAFPVTYGMLLMSRVFFDAFNNTTPDQHPFTPPLLGNLGNTSFLAAIIGVGVVLLTPQVVEMTGELFKVQGFKHGASINQAIGVGMGVTNISSHASTIGNTLFGLSHVPIVRNIPWIKELAGPGGVPHGPGH